MFRQKSRVTNVTLDRLMLYIWNTGYEILMFEIFFACMYKSLDNEFSHLMVTIAGNLEEPVQ